MRLGRRERDDGRGEIFRRLHWQCWQADAPPLEIDLADLVAVLPVLIESGSVGLIWPRLRAGAERYGAIAAALEQAYQSQVEHNALVEQRIGQAATRLQAEGIEPVIVKGWSIARLYPEGLVRPAGDMDLVVPEQHLLAALETLYAWAEETGEISIDLHDRKTRPDASRQTSKPGVRAVGIDLHRDTLWDSSPGPDTLQHARRIPVRDGAEIRVLRTEDSLRQMSFHYLWHGATRLLRLCDIAMVLENRPADFDWDRCLGTNPVRANWVTTAVGLAHHLTGAQIDDTPVAGRADSLPGWLLPVAARQVVKNQPSLPIGFMDALAHPRHFPRMLWSRWWDPISATVRRPTAFDDRPRLPVQLAVYTHVFARYGRDDLLPKVGGRLSQRLRSSGFHGGGW